MQIVNIKKKETMLTDPPSETLVRQCQTNIYFKLGPERIVQCKHLQLYICLKKIFSVSIVCVFNLIA